MRVGVPGGDIVLVQRFRNVYQLLAGPQGFGQGLKQGCNRMSRRLTARFYYDRFDSFLGALLGGKASPLIVADVERMTSVVQISPALFHPIRMSARHRKHHVGIHSNKMVSRMLPANERGHALVCHKFVLPACPYYSKQCRL